MLCFGKFPVANKFMDKKGGGGGEYRNLPSKNFCLAVPKYFVGEPLSVSLISGIGKILCFRGLCHDSPSKIFCLTVPKHFVEEPFCAAFQKISGNEKVYG